MTKPFHFYLLTTILVAGALMALGHYQAAAG